MKMDKETKRVIKHHMSAVKIPLWVQVSDNSSIFIDWDTYAVSIPLAFITQHSDTTLAKWENGMLEFTLGHEIGHVIRSPTCMSIKQQFMEEIARVACPGIDWSDHSNSSKSFIAEVANVISDPMATEWAITHSINQHNTVAAINKFYSKRQFSIARKIHDLSALGFIKLMTNKMIEWKTKDRKPKFQSEEFEFIFSEMYLSNDDILARLSTIAKILKPWILLWSNSNPKKGTGHVGAHQKPGPASSQNLPVDKRDLKHILEDKESKGEKEGKPDSLDKAIRDAQQKAQQDHQNKGTTIPPLEKICDQIALDMLLSATIETNEEGDYGKPTNESQIWRPEDKISELDIALTIRKSGVVIPGVTTRKRPVTPDDEGGNRKKIGALYLLLDTSGSMYATMGQLMTVAFGCVKGAETTGHLIGLTQFNHSTGTLIQAGREYDKCKSVISALVPMGGTHLYSAVAQVKKHIKDNDERASIVAITDGELTNDDINCLKPLQPYIALVGRSSILRSQQVCLNQEGLNNVFRADTTKGLTDLFKQITNEMKDSQKDETI